MHNYSSKLYGTRTKSEILSEELILPYGRNPSLTKPNLILFNYAVNDSYRLSNDFQVVESTGCLIISLLLCFSLCHLISLAISLYTNNLLVMTLLESNKNLCKEFLRVGSHLSTKKVHTYGMIV